ncbi:hypothetical protein EHR02_00155, partial [Leptospira levettii]|uniref:hypothetical protein n=1 Tax=Leptospira levettii TaxID=2023178 RepID=UPI0010825BCA
MKSNKYKNQKTLAYMENKNFMLNVVRKITEFYLLTTIYSLCIYKALEIIDFTPGIGFLIGLAILIFILEFGYNIMITTAKPLTTIILFYSRSFTIGLISAFLSKSHEDQCFQIIQFSYFLMFSCIFLFFKITQNNIQNFALPKFIIPYLVVSSFVIPFLVNNYGVLHWVIVFVYAFPYLIIFNVFFKKSLQFNKIGNEDSQDDKIEILMAALYFIDI